MSMATVRTKQFTGKHMLASIVAFFGVIIRRQLHHGLLANSTWSGLVVANGYVASQSFDKDLATAARPGGAGLEALSCRMRRPHPHHLRRSRRKTSSTA